MKGKPIYASCGIGNEKFLLCKNSICQKLIHIVNGDEYLRIIWVYIQIDKCNFQGDCDNACIYCLSDHVHAYYLANVWREINDYLNFKYNM